MVEQINYNDLGDVDYTSGTQNTQSVSDTSSFSSNSSSSQILDSISSLKNTDIPLYLSQASNPKLYPPLISVLNDVAKATNSNKKEQFDKSVAISTKTAEFQKAMTQANLNLVDYFTMSDSSQDVANELALYEDKLRNMNQFVNDGYNNTYINPNSYNIDKDNQNLNAIRDATIALNAAITNYNNNPSAQNLTNYNNALNIYNSKIQDYNTYIAVRNNQAEQFNYVTGEPTFGFNAETTKLNYLIQKANEQRAAYGLDPIPYQLGYPFTAPTYISKPTIPGGAPLTTLLPVPEISDIKPLPLIPKNIDLNDTLNPLNDLVNDYNYHPSRTDDRLSSNALYRQSLVNLQAAATALKAADPINPEYATLLANYTDAISNYNQAAQDYNQFATLRNIDVNRTNAAIDAYNLANIPIYDHKADLLEKITNVPLSPLTDPNDLQAIIDMSIPEITSSPQLPLADGITNSTKNLNAVLKTFNNFPPPVTDDKSIMTLYKQALLDLQTATNAIKSAMSPAGTPIFGVDYDAYIIDFNDALVTYNKVSQEINQYRLLRNPDINTINAAIAAYNATDPDVPYNQTVPLIDEIPDVPWKPLENLNLFQFQYGSISFIPVPSVDIENLPPAVGISPEVTALNKAIDAFNDTPSVNTDQTQIQKLQAAIVAINNAKFTYDSSDQTPADLILYNQALEDYNNAVNIYNEYANLRNDTLDDLITKINQANVLIRAQNEVIDAFNQKNRSEGNSFTIDTIDEYDVPQILPLGQSIPPATVPVDQTSASSYIINSVGPFAEYDFAADQENIKNARGRVSPTSSQFYAIYMMAGFASIQKQLELNVNFYLRNKTSDVGNAVSLVTDLLKERTSVKGGALGSSAMIGAMAETLDPIVSSNVFNLTIQNSNYADFFSRINSLEFMNLFANNQLNVNLLNDAIHLVNKSPIDISASQEIDRFQQALAFENLNNLSSLNFSNTSEGAVANLAAIASGLSLLTNQLKGDPSIANLILTTSGFSTAEIFNINSQGISNRQLLNDPFAGSVVADNLATKIAETTGNLNLQGQIKEAIIAANKQSGLIDKNLTINLQNLGIDAGSTSNLLNGRAFESRVDFRDQISKSLIDQGYSNEDVLHLTSQSAGISSKTTNDAIFSTNDVNQTLLSANLNFLLSPNKSVSNPSAIATAVAQAFSENVREVKEDTARDNIQYELVRNGLSKEDAANIAAGVSFSTEPLKIASRQDLAKTLQGIYTPLLGRQQAMEKMQELANNLAGPANITASNIRSESHQTLTSVIKNDLNVIKDREDQSAFNATLDIFRQNNARTTDLFASQALKLDPGTAIANSLSVRDAPIAPAGGPVKMGGTHQVLDVPV